MTLDKFVEYLHRQAAKCGTKKEYAYQIGVTPQYLNDVLNGSREPGKKILDGAGFERVVSYRRKEQSQ